MLGIDFLASTPRGRPWQRLKHWYSTRFARRAERARATALCTRRSPWTSWSGSMHEVLSRHNGLDPSRIDDVVLGCVTPIGDQGADIAKTAAIKAGLPDTVAGVQLNRFCASGLEAVNVAAQKVASGWEDLVLAGGVESMSRVPMGSDGGAWAMDPETNYDTSFVPQGDRRGPDRDDRGLHAATTSTRTPSARRTARPPRRRRALRELGRPRARPQRQRRPRPRRVHPPRDHEGDARRRSSRAFAMMGEHGGFDAVALQKYHWVEAIDHVHTPGNSSGIVDGASLVAVGSAQIAEELGLKPRARIVATAVSGSDPTIMLTGPAPATAQGARQGRDDRRRPRPDRDQRGVRGRRAALRQGHGARPRQGQRQRRRDRHGPSAGRHRRHDPRAR